MSLQLKIDAFLDDTQAKQQQNELELKNEKIKEAIDENEKRTKEAFTQTMAAMRAGYMMISGIAGAIGGSMGQVFSAMYGAAVSAIGTYQAIAAAMAASGPAGWIQAGLMTMSLITAISSLVGVMTGQEELSKRLSGLNMALHGISGLYDSFSL